MQHDSAPIAEPHSGRADAVDDRPHRDRDAGDNHVIATGIGVFIVCVAIAAWAFPTVRDLSLFESVYVWICSPFIG